MESFKNVIRTYRQKFTNVAAEIYKVNIIIFYVLNFRIHTLILLIRLKYWLDAINTKAKN